MRIFDKFPHGHQPLRDYGPDVFLKKKKKRKNNIKILILIKNWFIKWLAILQNWNADIISSYIRIYILLYAILAIRRFQNTVWTYSEIFCRFHCSDYLPDWAHALQISTQAKAKTRKTFAPQQHFPFHIFRDFPQSQGQFKIMAGARLSIHCTPVLELLLSGFFIISKTVNNKQKFLTTGATGGGGKIAAGGGAIAFVWRGEGMTGVGTGTGAAGAGTAAGPSGIVWATGVATGCGGGAVIAKGADTGSGAASVFFGSTGTHSSARNRKKIHY